VLHTRPAGMRTTREPLQFGAEIYGHAGLEADVEVQDLALDCLRAAGVGDVTLDLGDARVVRALLAGATPARAQVEAITEALAAKDSASLAEATRGLDGSVAAALRALPELYGDETVLAAAARLLPAHAALTAALADLRSLARHARDAHPGAQVCFDLADLTGYAYYSGPRFAMYAPGSSDAVARGGRYDEVGAVFGRNRPAVGFSLDLKVLGQLARPAPPRAAIRAAWGDDPALRAEVRALRQRGETVVCMLPGHDHEGEEFDCDRELALVEGVWVVRAG
jgi:ATP phosphoribosyltransferase regulatory subunit